MTKLIALLAAAGLAALAAAPPALAQKAQDTIRVGVIDGFSVLDNFHFPHDEAGQFGRNVYQALIAYDEHAHKWVNVLAKSFKRVDANTIEFELREGVTFHNGNKFDADDVKLTFDYLRDPAVKIRFKERYTWVKEVEILSPHKVRIHASKSFAADLGTIAYRIRLYDAETHNALKEKADYGKTAIGTAPYRMVSLDRNNGIVVERVENHWDKSGYFPAPVKRVHGLYITDRQTQIAQLLTGGIDLMRNVTVDDMKSLGANPNLGITPSSSSMLMYVTFDAAGRSSSKVMTDKRVRQAFIQAIDRNLLIKNLVPGGAIAEMTRAICFKSTIGCAPTNDVHPFDPANAKRLLAEAGFPNGFDLTLHVHEPIKFIGEAIAGEVRKVGIRASVEPLPNAVYTKKRGDGEFTAFTGFYPAGTHPDMAVMWDFFFGGDRDYWRDDFIHKAQAEGDAELDDKKRTQIYAPALDKINREAYILPVSELPIVWAHHKDVYVNKNPLSAAVPILGDYGWR